MMCFAGHSWVASYSQELGGQTMLKFCLARSDCCNPGAPFGLKYLESGAEEMSLYRALILHREETSLRLLGYMTILIMLFYVP